MPLPNLIIAGPPKAGTTSLFNWLSSHPAVCPSSIKEPDYFKDEVNSNSKLNHFIKSGWQGYYELFDQWKDEKVIFEASPKYIYSRIAFEKLYEIDPLKIIFVKREEPSRLYSEYRFHKYKTKLFKGDFEKFLHSKGYDLEKGIKPEQTFEFLVNKWILKFGYENIRVIDFEDLTKNPLDLMKALCNYLQIDGSHYENYVFEQKNKTQNLKNRKLHYWLLGVYDYIPKRLVKTLSKVYFKLNSSEIPPTTEREKKLMTDIKEAIAKVSLNENTKKWHWLR